MGHSLDRRLFVLGSLAGLGAFAPQLRAGAATGNGRTLVLIQLSGGNDGFSTLVPYSHDAYARARRTTRFGASEVLRIDARVGLHPRLRGLREAFERGHLAIVEGIGYPGPSRSHFRSLDVWHAASPRGRAAGTGWVGRAIDRLPGAARHALVHLGSRPPFALHSASRSPLCIDAGLLRLTDPATSRARTAARELGGTELSANPRLALLQAVLREAQSSFDELRGTLVEAPTRVTYPAHSFAQELRQAAALIHAELGVRVCSIELGSFDTHHNQRERHDRLLAELDGGLAAFLADLEQSEAGRNAVVVLFSEFGRRVAENASGGTDHGAAGLALVLGASVRGGFHGRPPELESLENGDLAFTTDFRSLYAHCIRHVFELDPASVVGGTFPALDLA